MEIIPTSVSDKYLISQGYNLLNRVRCSRVIDLVNKIDKEKTVIKRDIDWKGFYQTLVENKILEEFNGLERIPKKIVFQADLIKKLNLIKSHSSDGYFTVQDYFLEEQFIEGKCYDYQQLSTNEEQKLIDLVKTFHNASYFRLDIRKGSNFILTPKGELYLVDLGSFIKKRGRFFNNYRKEDLKELDELLKKSTHVKGVM